MRFVAMITGGLALLFWLFSLAGWGTVLFSIETSAIMEEQRLKTAMIYGTLFFIPISFDIISERYERNISMNLILGVIYSLIFAAFDFTNTRDISFFIWYLMLFISYGFKSLMNKLQDDKDYELELKRSGRIVSKRKIRNHRHPNTEITDFDIEPWLISNVNGPVNEILNWMPESRREELKQEKPEEAKRQMKILVKSYLLKKGVYEKSGMNSIEAHWAAMRDTHGLPPD